MGPCSKTTRLHGLRVATGKRGWRALWLQSSANLRRCSMFVGGWPTCRRGLHGLDDPSWDRLPSGLIGKALGCGRVWTLQQCGGCRESAEKRRNCSEPPATRRKARATSWRTTTEQSCCQFFFLPSSSSTSYTHCLGTLFSLTARYCGRGMGAAVFSTLA